MSDYFHISLPQQELLNISSLGLAYVGDSVYEVMVRTWLCLNGGVKAGQLHRAALDYVSAPAQAARVPRILPLLCDEEQDVFRRGRNSAPHSIPHAASRSEYQLATALEALFGWLYLQGKTQRLNELFALLVEDSTEAGPPR